VDLGLELGLLRGQTSVRGRDIDRHDDRCNSGRCVGTNLLWRAMSAGNQQEA
jgi:hypothetical protein